jgi:ABC-2 type transport system ATP-binding protein
MPGMFRVEPGRDGLISVDVDDTTAALHTLTDWAVSRGIKLERLSVTRPSLEDVYLSITGEAGNG